MHYELVQHFCLFTDPTVVSEATVPTDSGMFYIASFPGLPRFFVLQFAFSIIYGSRRAAKNREGLGTP